MKTTKNGTPLLKEGDIIELGSDHTVFTDIPEHFVYSNRRGSWKPTRAGVKLDGQFSYLGGQYVVYKTAFEGGKTGQDAYPNGHHVYCRMVSDPDVTVDFYQSGSFGAMIKDITPIAREKRTYRVYFEQVNQTYVDVEAVSREDASKKACMIWRRDFGLADINSIEVFNKGE